MKYADKRIYIPSLEIEQEHDIVQKFDRHEYLEFNLENIAQKTKELLTQFPNITDTKTIRDHNQMCHFFAKRNGWAISNCYQYSGIDVKKYGILGLNIAIILPKRCFLITSLYTTKSQNISRTTEQDYSKMQSKAEFIYDIAHDVESNETEKSLILKDIIYDHFVKTQQWMTPMLYQENFSPREIEKVKKYQL